MEKVVVTGALGFIGFALCQRLLEKGYYVVGIDGMIDRRLENIYEEKLLWLGRNTQFDFIDREIETIDLNNTFANADAVYHMAAATSRERNWKDLRKTIEDNVGVTRKVIAACDKDTKLIYPSSTQVYGERSGLITEKTPLNPITPYSLTIMTAESTIRTECLKLEIPYTIFRLPTIYGPWQRSDMSYMKLIINELNKEEHEVDFDRVTEDVLYVEDILDTLIVAGEETCCKNEIYNLSTGKTNEWYRGRSLIDKRTIVEPSDKRLIATISNEKAANHLNFKAITLLEDGLKKQKEHIQKYKHIYLKKV